MSKKIIIAIAGLIVISGLVYMSLWLCTEHAIKRIHLVSQDLSNKCRELRAESDWPEARRKLELYAAKYDHIALKCDEKSHSCSGSYFGTFGFLIGSSKCQKPGEPLID